MGPAVGANSAVGAGSVGTAGAAAAAVAPLTVATGSSASSGAATDAAQLQPAVRAATPPFPAWKRGKVLGRGAHGTVYLGRVEHNRMLVAVKSVNTDGMDKAEMEGIQHEIDLMRDLKHTNLVGYLGTEHRRHALNIFLEYAQGGSLRQLLQEHGALPEPVAGRYTYQILLGLEYLHNRGIAHRDIKGANVLIGADGQCKLADFGASKSVEASSIVSGLKGGGWALFSYCYLLGPSIALIVLGGYTLLLLPPAPPY